MWGMALSPHTGEVAGHGQSPPSSGQQSLQCSHPASVGHVSFTRIEPGEHSSGYV